MTILTDDYNIKSVSEQDLLRLPSYLRLNGEIKSKLNKTLFNIGSKMDKLKLATLPRDELEGADRMHLMHLTKLGRISIDSDGHIRIIN